LPSISRPFRAATMPDISEKNFESTIESVLVGTGTEDGAADGTICESVGLTDYAPGGYRPRLSMEYDRALCLIPRDVLDFVQITQPKEWEKLKKQLGAEARDRYLARLAHEVEQRATLDVFRKGVRLNGCKFQLAYFRPASGLNPETQTLYEANGFTVVRQLKYSQKNENSLDLVLFLNGLPLFIAELKNPLMGQNVEDAMRQYKTTRDSREPLFAFGRCLAHFPVDPDLVYMTTRLEGPRTRFLPFNQGRGTGAGNPIPDRGFATAYLWERIWTRASVLDLIQNFIQLADEEDENSRKTGQRLQIFPR